MLYSPVIVIQPFLTRDLLLHSNCMAQTWSADCICDFQNGTACACLDCESSCPVAPPLPPAPIPFTLLGMDGYALVLLLLFFLGSLLFLSGVFCCTPSPNNTVGKSTNCLRATFIKSWWIKRIYELTSNPKLILILVFLNKYFLFNNIWLSTRVLKLVNDFELEA